MILVVAGILSAAFFWRLGMLILQAVAWPVMMGAAWFMGVLSGSPRRWRRWKAARAARLNAKKERRKG